MNDQEELIEKYREMSRNAPTKHLSDFFADKAAELSRKGEEE